MKFTVTCYLKDLYVQCEVSGDMENGRRRWVRLRELTHDEKNIASLITDVTTAKVVFTAQICVCIKAYEENKGERLQIDCIA